MDISKGNITERRGNMGIDEKEWREEQNRVEYVVDQIKNRLISLGEQISETKKDIVEIRKNFWDDVRINIDDAVEAAETYATIKQQAEVLGERERRHKQDQNQITNLKRLQDSPYFGRIDFLENNETETDKIYLGTASFLDEDGETFLVYDWRAPISSIYYDYPPGPAKFKTPVGLIEGEIKLKRQFIIRDSKMLSVFDTGVTIGDELLQTVLGKHSDMQMKSIVATIQKEQNQIIRNEQSKLLVVLGAAGSGKTSAALQRVAYLLYRYREILSAEQIILFSPNQMFNSYISTVLPELGEQNMQQTTFQDYLEARLKGQFQVEDQYTQMEFLLTAENDLAYSTRREGILFKSSGQFMKVMERYIDSLAKSGMQFKDIHFKGRILFTSTQIKEKFSAFDSSIRIPNRLQLVKNWLLDELKEFAKIERNEAWVEEETQYLDNEAYLRSYQQSTRRNKGKAGFGEIQQEHEILADMVMNKHLKPVRSFINRLGFIDISAVYRQLFSDPAQILQFITIEEAPKHLEDICTSTIGKLGKSELAYEDATPYLYLKDRIEGFKTNTTIRYVFIDEAQDYSPFQFAFIRQLFPFSKMTVLGDLNQAIYLHSNDNNALSYLQSLYQENETETIILNRSYRSTKPIIEFTSGMIAGGDLIEAFNREGDKPTIRKVENLVELYQQMVGLLQSLVVSGHQTIAVICKTAHESIEVYQKLKDQVSLTLISKETLSFKKGVYVIPSYLAKGLEFDAVIISNASSERYYKESERKLFYTACTRAMHELHLYSIGELTPFICGIAKDTYKME